MNPLLRGVDRAGFAVAFAERLRAAGVPVGFDATQRFCAALAGGTPSRTSLYWTARVTLVARQPDLAVFDAVFAAVFDAEEVRLDPAGRERPLGRSSAPGGAASGAPSGEGGGLPWVTRPAAPTTDREDGSAAATLPRPRAGALRALDGVPFESLTAAELALLGDHLEAALRRRPTRRSRRLRPHPAGHRISPRATLARSGRTGFELVEPVRMRQLAVPRRLVLLCDVSRSMQPYATAWLHLMRAAARAGDAEVFAFSTSLTRLTPVLAGRSAAAALERATEAVGDRFGGTRIGAGVRALLTGRHAGCTRGAIVVIASDGWDAGDPAELGVAMARLSRRARSVLWVNPRAGAPGFEPRTGAMAAALPCCDLLLPGATMRDLLAVVREISSRG